MHKIRLNKNFYICHKQSFGKGGGIGVTSFVQPQLLMTQVRPADADISSVSTTSVLLMKSTQEYNFRGVHQSVRLPALASCVNQFIDIELSF